MFSFVNSILPPARFSSCSSTGVIAWHGPHHGAQKSTSTGFSARRTSVSKLASVTSRTATKRTQPEEGHLPDALEHDRVTHLRASDLTVDEHDRHLDDAEARAHRPAGGLDLEGVALRVDRVEVDRLQHLPPVALEPPGEVTDGHAEDQLGVKGAAAGN